MLTPAMSASRTSEPCVIISNAFATHVCPLSFFDRLPFEAAITSGLTPPVFRAGDWPNSGLAAAITPAALVVWTNSRRLILLLIVFLFRVRLKPDAPYCSPPVPFLPVTRLLLSPHTARRSSASADHSLCTPRTSTRTSTRRRNRLSRSSSRSSDRSSAALCRSTTVFQLCSLRHA